jgi:hypothetical protein
MKHGWHCIWMSMLNVWLLVDMTTHTLIDRIVTDSSNQPAEIKNERAAPLCHPKESLSYDAVDNAHAADCSWLQEFACKVTTTADAVACSMHASSDVCTHIIHA